LGRPLVAQRALQSRLRDWLSRISASGADMLSGDRLRELRAAFQEHARFEEQVTLPTLESLIDERRLDSLGQAMGAARKTAFEHCRKTNG